MYCKEGLTFENKSLELELELPELTESHDNRRVKICELTSDLDSEKLRFYLSALSDNVVAEIYFNENHTKAVATFVDPIGK